ncbi:SagB family peptide dehydrogenase [Amycolatopsis nigrescens]|uniref:SagB family peptide dehydrogenase n=1 Tax=Amycolatopsis nigrescens TaxID=381445 RepID=UPI0004760B7F|nr:SagB family peptide dehydrogenase [Amycolatopsis nigrescens]
MRVRVSACGSMFWDDGRLVWDDYLGHRQLALTDGTERVLRWFVSWREVSSIEELDPDPAARARLRTFTEQMLGREILIEEDSPRHRAEQRVLRSWSAWGPSTRAFHFATRSHRSTPFVTVDESRAQVREKLLEEPPPPPFKPYPDVPRISLPFRAAARWELHDFADVLYQRRSNREFGDSPLELSALGALLDIAGRPTELPDRPAMAENGNVFKTSPSGGARHPTEIYVYARNVEGLEPSLYHYDGGGHALERLGTGAISDAEIVAAAGDQDWVAGAAALLIYTSVIDRCQWKYPISRTYRIMMMDLGHLSQTVYLAAAALGLHITYTAALRDECLEDLIQCDPADEIVLGISAVGPPTDRS